ncbi:MAG: tetR 1 [Naasia sp.]|nr:tetR 1 [Naasia sp.]
MARSSSGNPELSREAIISAAIDLVDEVGLDQFAVRSLARNLNVFPAALYWYIGSRSRLLSLAAGRLMAQIQASQPDGDSWSWQRSLSDCAHQMRAVMHRHPNFSSIFGAQLGVDIVPSMPFVETLVGTLTKAGFEDSSIVRVFNAFSGSVFGWVSIELSSVPKAVGRDENWQKALTDDLESLDPTVYPHTVRVLPLLANRAFMMRWTSGVTNPLDQSFDFLLGLLISGFEVELERQAAERSSGSGEAGTPAED